MSLFQRIPWDVAYEVVCYVADRNPLAPLGRQTLGQLHSALRQRREKEFHVLSPLLEASQIWRSAALVHQYHTLDIDLLPSQKTLHLGLFKWPKHLSVPGHYANDHVQCVSIQVNLGSIMCGALTTMLHSEQLQLLQFRHARTVDMSVNVIGGHTKEQWACAEDRVAEFSNQLFALLPAATSFNIGIYGTPGPEKVRKGRLVSTLLHCLSSRTSKLRLDVQALLPIPVMKAKPIAILTSLTTSMARRNSMMAKMVVQHSQTLQELEPDYMDNAFLGTIVGSSGASIRYPQLTKLVVWSSDYRPSENRPRTTTGCPFPALCHLNITDGYPFSDDTLFRGNHETLQTLVIPYSMHTLRVLNGYLKASRAIFSSLRQLSMRYASWENNYDGKDIRSAIAPILGRSPSLQNLSIEVYRRDDRVTDVAAWLGLIPKHIRLLKMPGKDLSINEFILVVRELPLLESLTCGVKLDNEAGEIDASQVATLTETDIPLSSTFRRWIPIMNTGHYHCNVDQWNKILSGVCPNFDYRGTECASDEPASSKQTSEWTSDPSIYTLL